MRTFSKWMSAAVLTCGTLFLTTVRAQENSPAPRLVRPGDSGKELVKEAGKQISFELVIVERAADLAAADLQKPPTAALIAELEKQGKVSTVQRLKLIALENVESTLQIGEQTPVVTSRVTRTREGSGGFGGATFPGQESITYMDIGSLVTITARVEADGKVVARIHLARTGLAPVKPTEKIEGQEAPASSSYPRKVTTSISTTAKLAPNETVVLAGQQLLTGNSPTEFWVQVTATVQ